MKSSKTARKLRVRIAKFSGDLSKGLCKRAQEFVGEMVYGIQASESVLLTQIGRTLEEEISLKKTHERLSRNLMRKSLEKILQENLLQMAARHVSQDMLIVIDPSDLAKKYARKMEYLARVRDGSEHDFANGYHTLHVIGTQIGSHRIVPLYQRLWSSKAPGFVSENEEILEAVRAIMGQVGRRGIYVIDRGGDRINLFAPMLDLGARFLIRLIGNRHMVYNHKTLLAEEIACSCPCHFSKVVTRIEHGVETSYTLTFGCRKVRLPGRSEPLYLLVIRGFGAKPMLLLTNEPLRPSFKSLWRMMQAYLKRWSIEETIRYIKTCYDLENVRVLNYQGLQNLMPLVLAVVFFLACILDQDTRLRVMANYIEKAAKRLFGVPDFKYYALADGLHALLTRYPGKPQPQSRAPNSRQMELLLFCYR